jgi:type IV pilus assembly protein PilB
MDIDTYSGAHWPVQRGTEVGEFIRESRNYCLLVEQKLLDFAAEKPGFTLRQAIETLGPQLGSWPEGANQDFSYGMLGNLDRLTRRGILTTDRLYSALSKVNTEDVNIMTAEDPVEYNLHGINQVLVRTQIGMTFAAALKAFLRQDPNIIIVGEIRDIETGGIGIKAALTGHLVLSTLHTNDAPSTVTRMLDMGLEPFNLASALNLISAQRLLRRICKNCKKEKKYDEAYFKAAKVPMDWVNKMTFYKGEGCDQCNGSGYKGRAGVYEVMAMSPDIRKAIMKEMATDELRELAVSEGMLTLRSDGLKKVEKGVTTMEEVIKETTAV